MFNYSWLTNSLQLAFPCKDKNNLSQHILWTVLQLHDFKWQVGSQITKPRNFMDK